MVTIMPSEYEGLYAWANEVFGREAFTINQFRETFQSPDPQKVLSDLRRLGYTERVGRGEYRVTPPDDRLNRIVKNGEARFEVPENAGLNYAYSDATAITVWTDGGYLTGSTKSFHPLHMRVKEDHVQEWRKFLRARGYSSAVPGERRTLFGTVFILHAAREFESVAQRGIHVIPLREAYEFAKDNSYAFEPVIPLLAESLKAEEDGRSKKRLA